MDNENQGVDTTNSTEEVVIEETNTEAGAVETTEEVVEETVPKSQFNQVLARAKKAEEALKKSKPSQTDIKTNSNSNSALTEEAIEKKILMSQGMSEELVNELVTIAKLRGKSPLATTADPLFIAIKDLKDAEVKSQKAKLGASKGSGSVKAKKDFNTPGLSAEEHKAMWREAQE